VRRHIPNISLGTVYRNLQKLVAEGKLQVLTLGRTQHFDPLLDSHEHFICQTCGRVYDILVGKDEKILPASLPQGGFTVTSYRLAFFGECKSCSGDARHPPARARRRSAAASVHVPARATGPRFHSRG